MNKLIYIEKLAEVKGGLPARSMEEHIMVNQMITILVFQLNIT